MNKKKFFGFAIIALMFAACTKEDISSATLQKTQEIQKSEGGGWAHTRTLYRKSY